MLKILNLVLLKPLAMKTLFTIILILFPLSGICQSATDISSHEDSTNFIGSFKSCYIQLQPNSSWQIGRTNKSFFNDTKGPMLITDTISNIGNSLEDDFILGVHFENSKYANTIKIKHKYSFDGQRSGGFISISNDMGQSWKFLNLTGNGTFIGPVGIKTHNCYDVSGTDTLSGGIQAFTGQQTDWIETWIRIDNIIAVKGNAEFPDTSLFKFTFKATNALQKPGWAIKQFDVYFPTISDVPDLAIKSDFKLFPNPALNSTLFSCEKAITESALLSIYAIDGRCLYNQVLNSGESNWTLPVNTMAKGQYELVLYYKNQVLNYPLVIQ